MKKNGVCKAEYQQHNMNGAVIRNLDELYSVAEPAKGELKFFLNQLVQEVKGLEVGDITVAPLKPRDRAFEK